jgi:hypothetical protein
LVLVSIIFQHFDKNMISKLDLFCVHA